MVGFSYGTNIGRQYAHRFPTSLQKLILEGLSSKQELTNEQTIIKLIRTIEERFKASKDMQSLLSADLFKNFLSTLQNYFAQVSPQTNFAFAALWWKYQQNYEAHYKSAGSPIPKYLNRDTFLSVTWLMYSGENTSSDYAIWMLLNNFGFVLLSTEQVASIAGVLKKMDKTLFPFLDADYLGTLKESQVLSWRVQLAMLNNDQNNTGRLHLIDWS